MYAYTRERDKFVRNTIAFSLLVGIVLGSAVWKVLS